MFLTVDPIIETTSLSLQEKIRPLIGCMGHGYLNSRIYKLALDSVATRVGYIYGRVVRFRPGVLHLSEISYRPPVNPLDSNPELNISKALNLILTGG